MSCLSSGDVFNEQKNTTLSFGPKTLLSRRRPHSNKQCCCQFLVFAESACVFACSCSCVCVLAAVWWPSVSMNMKLSAHTWLCVCVDAFRHNPCSFIHHELNICSLINQIFSPQEPITEVLSRILGSNVCFNTAGYTRQSSW